MSGIRLAQKTHGSFLRHGFLCGMGALMLWGCSSNGTIEEATYTDGMETNSAVVQETPNGGYRTISGDPEIVVNGDIEPESMLPYGGGDEGIRQAEDETPFPMIN